jgi:hypothetical protein
MFSCLSVVASAADSDYQLDAMLTVSGGEEGAFVEEISVKSIEFTPAEPYVYIENLDGFLEVGEDYSYFYYNFDGIRQEGNELTVEYSDGSSETFVYEYAFNYEYGYDCYGWYSNEGFISQYEVSYYEEQEMNTWTVGDDNYVIVEYAGRSCKVPVTIEANPVESIEFIPKDGSVFVFENKNGDWRGYWDDEAGRYVETYYEYNFREIVEKNGNAIKVNYTDNTTSTYYYNADKYCWIDEFGERLVAGYLDFWTEQWEGNPWSIGENWAYVEYYGKMDTVTVKVLEPIPDVTDGIFTAEVVSETECYITKVVKNANVGDILTIPEKIQGYTVTGMESWLVSEYYSDITEINLPSGFESFSTYQFNNCEFLEKVNVAECLVLKNRHGEVRTIELGWDDRFTRFSNLEFYRNDE